MKGLGFDLCGIDRIERAIAQNDRFLERWYTPAERAYIHSRGNAGAQSAAAMFAAKEAFLKALGAPHYALTGAAQQKLLELGAKQAWLSLTHENGMAAAVCVIE